MIKPLDEFVKRFRTRIVLDETLLVEKEGKYYLLNKKLRKRISSDFLYAGTYLGKTRHKEFVPSFPLLNMIAKTDASKAYVDEKTEWLFICGRDVFKRGIKKTTGTAGRGDYTLVMNLRGECLGFGQLLVDSAEERESVAVQNLLDLGDFLRRERQH